MVVEELKCNISISLVLELPNLYKPFKVDIDVIMYVMGEMLAQGGKLVCYHFELFYGVVLYYPKYDKELYSLV